ncbi:glycoside hydrolase family 15 protein [Acuticoccus sp.]|uniref:glycoside hydrolase family 15 protein n=1 Tax=Acuticoccus sp. TaxID=1904378 RepID=UPI003B51E321
MDVRLSQPAVAEKFPAIRDLAAIGNLETVALVADTGAVELFSYPHFDSPTVFAAALDRTAGAFVVRPTFAERGNQRYLPNTNVLVTRYEAHGNVVEVTDFMPVGAPAEANQMVRIATCVAGEAEVVATCQPAFDYARRPTHARAADGHVIFEDGGSMPVRLVADRPLSVEGNAAVVRASLREGERLVVNLVCDNASTDLLTEGKVDAALEATIGFWQGWTTLSGYDGPWREAVMRSALALKLMVSNRHGAMVAAPSFGLPEAIGAARNWDYRYCWARDSAFTVYAFLRLGFMDEAEHYRCWIRDRIEEEPRGEIQLMYRVDGSTDLAERELDHLSGYQGSRPVRIGNAAFDQSQIDTYGEVIDTLYLAHGALGPVSERSWDAVSGLADTVCANWDKPGAGFWEMRGEPQHFLDGRLMSWVGLNRALRLSDKTGLEAAPRWRETVEAIAEEIEARYFNEAIGAYTQVRDGAAVDATALLMPLMKFVPTTSDRFRSTLAVIEERLVADCLVRRYEADAVDEGVDGSREGAFVACSFWYIEVLARSRRVEEARAHFETMLSLASPVGLYAEEVDHDGRHLGNTPQALSHLAMISAAVALDRATKNGGEPF